MAAPAATTPFTLASLKTELQSDPVSVGYAAAGLASANDQAVAALLNLASGTGAGPVYRNDIKTSEILNAIVSGELATLTALKLQQLGLFLQNGILDATISNVRSLFVGIFSGMSGTLTNLNALAVRTGSRAEVLWGTGTIITPDLVSGAR